MGQYNLPHMVAVRTKQDTEGKVLGTRLSTQRVLLAADLTRFWLCSATWVAHLILNLSMLRSPRETGCSEDFCTLSPDTNFWFGRALWRPRNLHFKQASGNNSDAGSLWTTLGEALLHKENPQFLGFWKDGQTNKNHGYTWWSGVGNEN